MVSDSYEINLPLSKSIYNRLQIIHSFLDDKLVLPDNVCNDILVLNKTLNNTDGYIDCEDCGSAFRFILARLVLNNGKYLITGNKRLRERPISNLVETLKEIGFNVEYLLNNDKAPILIYNDNIDINKMSILNNINIDGSISSQFISALMLIGPYIKNGLIINVTGNIVSKSYIMMTYYLMLKYGIDIKINDNIITIKEGKYKKPNINCVEYDWSAAAFWYEICFITGKPITINGLTKNSLQGDNIIKDIFYLLGIDTKFCGNRIKVFNTMKDFSNFIFKYDFKDCPDLVIPIVISLCERNIKFRITGISTLFNKECNRVEALINEMKKIGCNLIYDNNELIYDNNIDNKKKIQFNTYNDHRMAMGLLPLLLSKHIDMCDIDSYDCIKKSYPNFIVEFKEFKKIIK